MAHVLVVNDEEVICELLRRVCDVFGHTCDATTRALDGLDLALAHDYDVITVNWRMPELSGVDLVRRLGPHVVGRTPIVFESGSVNHLDQAELEELRRNGVVTLLPSPFELDDLRQVFRDALALRSAFQHGFVPLSRHAPSARPIGALAERRDLRRVVAHRDRLASALAGAYGVPDLPPDSTLLFVDSPLDAIRTLAGLVSETVRIPDGMGWWFLDRGFVDPLSAGFEAAQDIQWPLVMGELRARIGPEAGGATVLAFRLTDMAVCEPFALSEEGGRYFPHGSFGWAFTNGLAMVSRCPFVYRRDPDTRPHAEDGPALVYDDGFPVCAWHGAYIEPRLLEDPASVTPEDIRTQPNAEVRRFLRERYGELRYLTDGGAQMIAVDTVPVDAVAPGARCITRVLLEDHERRRFLVASDGSTRRVYHMEVPRECRTCQEAYEALSGRTGYRTIVEA